MKYLVMTHCLEWHNIGYIVEFDTTDQIDVENIKEYED